MAILKCKMCGGNLELTENKTIAVCEYCGTSQTVPANDDEKKTNLFNRANRLRMSCEFDRAAGVYESIIAEFTEEAEAYWGVLLCKYGIEYVDDPRTALKVPTCHRTSFESIFNDYNYKRAIKYSDALSRAIYEKEAKAIDELQKDILSIVHSEEPFDVFICYKETDQSGGRTKDSVLAQDIYDRLTDRGFKVFFSRITLEDKLGKQYEPYIFAALNSAKVMLVVGTTPENFEAVWVKNEWGRFLSLANGDLNKTLIPCYKDMDPYDMPPEFNNLQAQDMSKIGFIQDLIRGIGKLLDDGSRETVATKISNPTVAPFLKRAFMFLEDGEWASADEYCEKVLDIDPENAEAYLGKLLVELKCCRKEELKKQTMPFDKYSNYSKAVRFADPQLKAELKEYEELVSEKFNDERKIEIYYDAVSQINKSLTEFDFNRALSMFETISDFRDSAEKIAFCKQKIEEIKIHEAAIKQKKIEDIYNNAVHRITTSTKKYEFENIISSLRSIGNYKDSAQQISICRKKVKELALQELKEEENKKEKQKQKSKTRKKYFFGTMTALPFAITMLALALLLIAILFPDLIYNLLQ